MSTGKYIVVIRTIQKDRIHILSLVYVSSTNMEEARLMTYTTVSHQGAIKTLWLIIISFIFTYRYICCSKYLFFWNTDVVGLERWKASSLTLLSVNVACVHIGWGSIWTAWVPCGPEEPRRAAHCGPWCSLDTGLPVAGTKIKDP